MTATVTTARARRTATIFGLGLAIAAWAWPGSAAAQINLDPINLALHKYAHQSSQYGGASADLAVDGNTDGNFFNGSVTHTLNDTNAWWEVDISYYVLRILEALRVVRAVKGRIPADVLADGRCPARRTALRP